MIAGLVAVLLGLAAPARAAGGGAPFAFLSLDGNARPAALGGAYAALATDAAALLYNPAGLGELQGHEATLMHQEHFSGLTQQYGGLALAPGFGFQFQTLGYGRTQRTTLSNPSGTGLGEFAARDLAVGAGWGRRVGKGLSLGLGLKHVRAEIAEFSGTAFAADLGVLWRPAAVPALSLGLAAQNLGPRVRFQSASEDLPLNVKLGAAYRARGWGREALLALDVDQPRQGGARVGVGLEAKPVSAFALRLGFDSRNDAGPGLTAGLGVGGKRLWADYAFVPFGALGSAHRVSVTLRWGGAAAPAAARSRARRARPDTFTRYWKASAAGGEEWEE